MSVYEEPTVEQPVRYSDNDSSGTNSPNVLVQRSSEQERFSRETERPSMEVTEDQRLLKP